MGNDSVRDEWSDKAQGWVRNQTVFDHAFAPFTEAVLGAASIEAGDRVLDVGCGAGTLLVGAADAGAIAIGVDIAPAMVEAARRREPRAEVFECDAQTAELTELTGGDFDVVVSRFGVMFFDDPVAAFANIRKACRPDARLAFVSWTEDERDLFTYGLEPFLARLADPPRPQAVNTPGPLGLATHERIESVLDSAGWVEIEPRRMAGTCDFGVDGSDGVDARLDASLSGTVGAQLANRLLPIVGEAGWDELRDEARDGLRRRIVSGSVRFDSSAWLVTASARRTSSKR